MEQYFYNKHGVKNHVECIHEYDEAYNFLSLWIVLIFYNENDAKNHFEHVHEYGKAYVHVEVLQL